MRLPPDECESIAREFLGGTGDRWRHVQLVASTTEQLFGDDSESPTLVAAAWLHDIGYAPELINTGMHAIDGAMYLDLCGAPPEIVSLVAFHTGAEFEADERGLVDDLSAFDRPPQDDLDALIFADLLSGPHGERIGVHRRLDDIFRRYESHHPVHRAVKRSRQYLEECAARAASRVGYPM